jgi:hypothetical protein
MPAPRQMGWERVSRGASPSWPNPSCSPPRRDLNAGPRAGAAARGVNLTQRAPPRSLLKNQNPSENLWNPRPLALPSPSLLPNSANASPPQWRASAPPAPPLPTRTLTNPSRCVPARARPAALPPRRLENAFSGVRFDSVPFTFSAAGESSARRLGFQSQL